MRCSRFIVTIYLFHDHHGTHPFNITPTARDIFLDAFITAAMIVTPQQYVIECGFRTPFMIGNLVVFASGSSKHMTA